MFSRILIDWAVAWAEIQIEEYKAFEWFVSQTDHPVLFSYN